MEELQARHRNEQRDLQRRITQKKKNATKKTRPGIHDECERLQRALDEQQQAERATLLSGPFSSPPSGNDRAGVLGSDEDDPEPPDGNYGLSTMSGESREMNRPSQSPTSSPSRPSSSPHPPLDAVPRGKKPNRQKARLARRAAERATQSAIAAEEAANQVDHRGQERERMQAAFQRLDLQETEINPDGHCLYSAMATQLDQLGVGLRPDPAHVVLAPTTASRVDTVVSPTHDGYRAVRAVTADFIRQHPDDFIPFLEEPLEDYTNKIRCTAEWGGQLELQALARAYGVEIHVVQGDGRIETIAASPEDQDKISERRVWLAYYRHTYGLGEHYNALSPKKKK
jgi:OTU domain-containing protein 6